MNNELFEDEGYQLMGAAFEVYNEQGSHLSEDIYQASLETELNLRDIPFDAQRQLDVFYKGVKLSPKFIPDLFIFDELIIELKAVKKLLTANPPPHWCSGLISKFIKEGITTLLPPIGEQEKFRS